MPLEWIVRGRRPSITGRSLAYNLPTLPEGYRWVARGEDLPIGSMHGEFVRDEFVWTELSSDYCRECQNNTFDWCCAPIPNFKPKNYTTETVDEGEEI